MLVSLWIQACKWTRRPKITLFPWRQRAENFNGDSDIEKSNLPERLSLKEPFYSWWTVLSNKKKIENKSCFVVFFLQWNEWKNSQFNFSSQNLSIECNFFKWDGKVTKIKHLLFHRIWEKTILPTLKKQQFRFSNARKVVYIRSYFYHHYTY